MAEGKPISVPSAARDQAKSDLGAALAVCRSAFVGIGLISAVVNVLYLTGSLFMLEVYDRVLPSRSLPTLVGLAVIVMVLYAFQGMLDILRSRLLIRIGISLDESLRRRVFGLVVKLPLKMPGIEALQPVRDLDQIRGFLSGMGPPALLDLPWMPLYLLICFLFHPLLGITTLIGAIILVGFTLTTEMLTRAPSKILMSAATARNRLSESGRRNAEVIHAMGMAGQVSLLWEATNARYLQTNQRTADIVGGLSAISKVVRIILQSTVLGVGAYLVIKQEATAGVMIAASIIAARALAPVELAIANWKGFVAARLSWKRLTELMAALPVGNDPMLLPEPKSTLSVEGVSAAPPEINRLVVQDVSFALRAGNVLGIIGPSASGKSSLARVLVGVWTPLRGSVRLDGSELKKWDPESLGRCIGYLPQDVELFAGTIAQNIARLDPNADPRTIIAAAQAANVHELIVQLPDGYDTQIGDGGVVLSAGQRQRIALARALYGDPFLILLDEPNSNLDAEGEQALAQAILGARARGAIVIVIAHRPSVLGAVDFVLMMGGGRVQAFGPKDEVLRKILRPSPVPTAAEGQMPGAPAPTNVPRVASEVQRSAT